MKNHLLKIALVFCFLYGCSQKEISEASSSEVVEKSLELLVKDTIQIPFLGNPTVHDIDPLQERIIFMEHKEYGEDIFIADFEGNILANFSKFGDVPDTYGNMRVTLSILGENKFMVYGNRGYLTYDFEGKLLSLVKPLNFTNYNFKFVGMGREMEPFEGMFLYFDQGSRNEDYSQISLYDELRLLNWHNPKSGEKLPFNPLPENSIFKSGRYFFRQAWLPAFTIADEAIYVAYGMEPVIYVFDVQPPHALKNNIPLDLTDYQVFEGLTAYTEDFRQLGLGLEWGRINNIKKAGDYFMVAYFPGYSAEDRRLLMENKSPEEAIAFRERMQKTYPTRIQVLDSLGKRILDFAPEAYSPETITVRDGKIWVMAKPNLEAEEDFFRIFRLELR